MQIIRKACAAANYRTGRQGYKVEAVVIHIVDGSIAGCDATFASSSLELRRSAHYCVAKTGRIHQYVDEQDTAYHAGRVLQPTWRPLKKNANGVAINPNLYTIGIEHEGRATDIWPDTLYQSSAELLADISSRYPALATLNRSNVAMHREIFAGKSCPGFKMDLERLIAQANSIRASQPAETPVTHGDGATAPQPALSPVQIVKAVKVRKGAPATTAPFVRILPPAEVVVPLAVIEQGQSVSGISRWFRIAADEYIWAGATVP